VRLGQTEKVNAMTEDIIPMTPDGFARLDAELKKLKEVERPAIIAAIAEARAHGDLKENAEYHAARDEQGFIEARIKELEGSLSRVKVIDFKGQNIDQVRIGAWVTLIEEESGEEKTVRVVGDLEANIDSGEISLSSPLAKALLGKASGDLVSVSAPKGDVEYSIDSIKY
jgi:transcription elongation factor GreA